MELILVKWAEYRQNLLNKVHNTDPGFQDDLTKQTIILKLDDPPSFEKVEEDILCLKDNKTAGHDNIPADVIKYVWSALHRRLHTFIPDCWTAKCLSQ